MKNKAWKKKFRQVQDLNPWPLRYWWSLSLSWFLPTRLLFSLSKHGHKCSCLPSTTGIIYMVVELNPGPVTSRALRIICRCLKHIAQRNWAKLMSHMTTFRPYFLLIVLCIIVTMLCVCALPIWICVRNRPRNWKYRGKRVDKLSKVKKANGAMKIPSIVCRRTFVNSRSLNNKRRSISLANLIPVESDVSAYNHRERISMLKALTWDP